YIIDAKSFVGFAATVIGLVCMLAPFSVLESITGQNLIRELSTALTGSNFGSSLNLRMGLHRAFGPFDHPILYGVFTASAIGLTVFLRSSGKVRRKGHRLRIAIVLAACVSSVSSGALAALVIQIMLAFWERFARAIQHRWILLSSLLLMMYIIIDLISNRSGIKVLLSYLTFQHGHSLQSNNNLQ
ncbi:unnamed protein product, partial [marine sediment metagenome]